MSCQSPGEISISIALLADANKIYELECLCFNTPWSQASLESLLLNPKSYCLVAVKESQIVGYIGFLYVMDEGEITNLAVDPDFRGQGIGHKLLESLLKWCCRNNILTVHLEVAAGNKAAIHLYSKCHFVKTGLRKGYYEDTKEDAWLFSWHSLGILP